MEFLLVERWGLPVPGEGKTESKGEETEEERVWFPEQFYRHHKRIKIVYG
jgi:hypothetical protein